MRKVAITVDVEAIANRATDNHIEKLIWGRQEGREAGIGTMMDLGDKFNAPITFFIDYPEREIWGDAILDVAREVKQRGHDAQPHNHLEYINQKLFGISDNMALRLPDLNKEQAKKAVDYLIESHYAAIGEAPLAHRSRGYEIGPPYLDALAEAGIKLDASYSLACKYKPPKLGLRSLFRFDNGLIEAPIPVIPFFRKGWPLVPWNFDHRIFLAGSTQENVKTHFDFLKAWFKRHGDSAIPTLVIHSRSLWNLDQHGFFRVPDDSKVELLHDLLEALSKEYEIISLAQITTQIDPDQLEQVNAATESIECPVCREPADRFKDYNAPKRQCGFCHSVERHRTLVDLVYAGAFGPQIFNNRKILHIAPGWPEKLLLRRMHNCEIDTLNILPGADLQADLQNMPEIEDNSYDIILASEVFRHVRDLDAALSEINRVLRPGGLLLFSDCLENKPFGREITEHTEQISWYGEEALQKYGIGDFRRFGKEDWERPFQKYFYTKIFKSSDKATGVDAWWCAATPKKPQDDKEELFSAACLRSNAGQIFHLQADPIDKFLPGLSDWQSLLKDRKPTDLNWLIDAILAMQFYPPRADAVSNYDYPEWQKEYDPSWHPYNDQSWKFLLRGLADNKTEFNPSFTKYLIKEILRWSDFYGFYSDSIAMTRHTRWMVWHDTAVAVRLGFMLYALLTGAWQGESKEDLDKVFRAIIDHTLLLANDSFYIKNYNHGLIQSHCLLATAKALPQLALSPAIQNIAEERIISFIDQKISTEGALAEHTPSYQAHILAMLTSIDSTVASRSLAPTLQPVTEKMEDFLTWEIQPNGRLAQLGDTSTYIESFCKEAVEEARPKIANGGKAFSESGYAFVRDPGNFNGISYLMMAGCFNYLAHKHCDDLGFIWNEGNCSILADSGEQYGYDGLVYNGPLWDKGFYFTSANRVYAESAHAHNVVEINGETWSRRLKPWGILPLTCTEISPGIWLLTGAWHRPENFLQKRRLFFKPGQWLLVEDRLEPEIPAGETSFTQWFHLGESFNLINESANLLQFQSPEGFCLTCQNFQPAAKISIHKGEIYPRLQGWLSKDTRTLEPAWALGIHQTAHCGHFLTLFSLIGQARKADIGDNHLILEFECGENNLNLANLP